MNILYIAYSCDPYSGSEDKIGWNIPAKSAQSNNVYVITKEEHRENIEKYLKENPIKNISFRYVDISPIYKKAFKSFLYSGRLNIWHKKAFQVAQEICSEHSIDIIHQITPIEFRSIGKYGKIDGIKFVCGPLGGGEYVPDGLKAYTKGHRIIESVRTIVNRWYRFKQKVGSTYSQCDYVMLANKETRDFLNIESNDRCLYNEKPVTEIAVDENDIAERKDKTASEKTVFLSAGRMIYRKGYSFLLDALEQLPSELDYELRIVGDGPESEQLKRRCDMSDKLKNHVAFIGKIPFSAMSDEYAKADAFILPSIRETTGSVLLEAMSKGLPVITIGKFGGGELINDNSGWLYSGNTKQEYIDGLKSCIIDCITNPQKAIRKGENARLEAQKHTWDEKIKHYDEIYRSLLKTGNMPE